MSKLNKLMYESPWGIRIVVIAGLLLVLGIVWLGLPYLINY
jgi:hypothetical protein